MELQNRKLGKLAPVHREGTLTLASYLPDESIAVPATLDYFSAIKDWGMMKNDELGDCTCAAAGHMIQSWTKFAQNHEVVLSDNTIVEAYSAITGYTPSNPATDQGAVETDVLHYWMTHGFGGHKIDSYAIVEVHSEYQMKLATYLFGAVYTGVALPISAQDQTIWSVVHGPNSEPGSWGGHAVPIMGYDANTLTCITWGAPLKMTWSWQKKYMDEAYVCLSLDWIDQVSKTAPNHLNWDKLVHDLKVHFKAS
jgi:hypothetical protein